jgi:hypothetical protein
VEVDMNGKTKNWRGLGLTLLCATGIAQAEPLAEAAPSVASPAQQELLRSEMRSVLARLIDSGTFSGQSPEQIALSLSLPAERVLDLGMVLDQTEQSLRVLATSPGGLAQQLGVHPGDVIVSANGQALGSEPATALKRVLDGLREGGELALRIERNGTQSVLVGTVSPRYLPAVRLELGEGALVASTAPMALPARVASTVPTQSASGDSCGRISVFHVAPRSQDLYRARILSIDGTLPGPSNQETYRVSPGTHEIEVAESIDNTDLPNVYTRARRNKNHTLTLEVEAGKTYLIAAHLNREKDDRVISGDYWNPVAWKEISEPCR